MLELKNISWTAPDGKQVLKDCSLRIDDGKLAVITGPNGSGKTTLARIIAGIEMPTSGRIMLDGVDITDFDVTQRAKQGVSFAFQQPVRFKGITCRQLIEIAAGNQLDNHKLCIILGRVGLCAKDYMDREVNSTLSGGEIKRIEIATVLARHMSLSLFDEPEAGIDLWSFNNLIEVFQSLRSNIDGTLLIISHQERILNIADEIILLRDGVIKQTGSADDMMSQINLSDGLSETCCRMRGNVNE